MKRPKQSDIAKSVDKIKPRITPEERRLQTGVAISVALVALVYIVTIFLVKGCIH